MKWGYDSEVAASQRRRSFADVAVAQEIIHGCLRARKPFDKELVLLLGCALEM